MRKKIYVQCAKYVVCTMRKIKCMYNAENYSYVQCDILKLFLSNITCSFYTTHIDICPLRLCNLGWQSPTAKYHSQTMPTNNLTKFPNLMFYRMLSDKNKLQMHRYLLTLHVYIIIYIIRQEALYKRKPLKMKLLQNIEPLLQSTNV